MTIVLPHIFASEAPADLIGTNSALRLQLFLTNFSTVFKKILTTNCSSIRGLIVNFGAEMMRQEQEKMGYVKLYILFLLYKM